ncbi:MAG: L,D-transpeptidase [Clostridiaceae bacterium]|nr:L,D-transpeptidase [Clostridiaceae bacterium]
MKKKHLFLLAAAAIILVTAVTTAVAVTSRDARRAAQEHAAISAAYRELRERAEAFTMTVTENGEAVGRYTFADLGVLEGTLTAIDALFSETERLTPEEFDALPLREKLAWHDAAHTSAVTLLPDMRGFHTEPVLRDLGSAVREPAQDASLSFSDGAYQIHAEVPGTVLREDVVRRALNRFVAELTVSPEMPDTVFELTDCDCYIPPEVTVENAGFDFAEALAQDLSALCITVDFHGTVEILAGETLFDLLSAGSDGRLLVNGEALDALVAGWAETYNAYGTPYLFPSYAGGVVPIDFLPCDYEVKTGELRTLLETQLRSLESADLIAPFDCRDANGEPFAIADTYVEVDITNQQLTYYQDGELIVHTDVVTGRPGGYKTPTGLYSSHDKQVNRWLIGEDYCVFVKYWVRVSGHYGLHDASWRTKFGGENYIRNGSHGCVNIPEEAMAVLYEHITDGTPVLIF